MELALIDDIFNWFDEHPSILIWLGGSSLFIFMFSILGVSWLVSQIPETYYENFIEFMKLWSSTTQMEIKLSIYC